MKLLFPVFFSLFIINISWSQVPILFYDFEKNSNRNYFENSVEQSILPGSAPIVRIGSGTIDSCSGNNGIGRGLGGNNWQNVVSDPGISATEYYQFPINTTGLKGITIKFRYSVPGSNGPGSFGINFSSNGTTYRSAGYYNTGGYSNTWSDAGFDLSNFPEVNNKSEVKIRIYAYKGASSDCIGLFAIDNLIVLADSITANAGEISLMNESGFYNSLYSGGTGPLYSLKKDLIITGPGTLVSLSSQQNFSQNIIVNSGATLDCGNFPLWGKCSFTLNKGGTLKIGSPAGIVAGQDSSGNICVKGTRTYSPEANYIYNGLTSQVTGNGFPSSANCFTINNNYGVELTDNLLVLDTLKLMHGRIFLGNRNLSLCDTCIVSGGSADSYLATNNSGGVFFNNMIRGTDVRFPVGTADSYNPVILNYTGTPDTFRVSVKPYFDNPPTDSTKVVKRQWSISESTPGGSIAVIKLCWLSGQETGGFNCSSNIMIGSWEPNIWIQTPAVFSGNGTPDDMFMAVVTGIVNFSNFGVGNDGALPVELTFFGIRKEGTGVILNWETATEINTSRFDIERRSISSLGAWNNIGFIKANSMSYSPKHYSYIEKNIPPGQYLYRLKMNYNDGSYEYSSSVEAVINPPLSYILSQNYPNPFNPYTTINYSLPFDSDVRLEIFNVIGEKVACLVNEFKKAGIYNQEFNAMGAGMNFPSGIYFYRITAVKNNGGSMISITKKMLLIK
jgi:hypothetical protein